MAFPGCEATPAGVGACMQGEIFDERGSRLMKGEVGHRNPHSTIEIQQRKLLRFVTNALSSSWVGIGYLMKSGPMGREECDRKGSCHQNSHSLDKTKQRKLPLCVCFLRECGISPV
ncbi:hypothetical protein EVAR_33281_1 [Eumeta japonica]|uniref:Uncharacterized protein n=1 Tax=Eumeta variegata TaxID=151549 RepID=A0A4C1X2R5_EUMVA|nr:hypothetical protein EVAR_33281_1 [Eumeta japonica]